MQLHQQPADQIHPVPLNFDPLHTYVGCFHKALKTILKKPVEQRITKGKSDPQLAAPPPPALTRLLPL